ncbi:MAG: c-type cytochrome [Candidatus Latescibacterota bacterium]
MRSPCLHSTPLLVLLFSLPFLVQAQRPAPGGGGRPAVPAGRVLSGLPADSLLVLGRYLTHQVAMCVECHSPRDGQGNLIPGQEFQGGQIPVRPHSAAPGREWAPLAPAIAGLVGYEWEDEIRLLTTGISRTGRALRSPMPPYKLSRRDAEAVVAYLKSLR